MIKAPVHPRESERQSVLERYQILDTLAEEAYDDITKIASAICGTPIAVISLIDNDRQWFKSKIGLDVSETPRDVAFCAHAILQTEVFVINDAANDKRFVKNPLVIANPKIRFYAGAPLRSPEGFNLGTICVIDTKPKILSEEQTELLQALSRQVMLLLELRLNLTRMGELTAELEKARNTAEDLSRSKSEFLAGMSHELRTPMNGIIGMMNLLRGTELTSEQQEYTDTIQNSATSLLTLLNDILDFSKIEAGKLNLESVEFNLDDILTDLERNFSLCLSEKPVKISVQKSKLTHTLIGDPVRLRQVLVNLIGNAMKFTEVGQILVTLEIKSIRSDTSHIKISVTDTGIGIPEASLKNLFSDFIQADVSTTRKYGGTGLGLSICRRLIHLMGGTINVVSKEWHGSTFWFDLEFKHGNEIQKVLNPSTFDSFFTKAEASQFHILVGEDNPVNQKVIQKTLEKAGLNVQIAVNGKEVLEALKAKRFDLILMDCQMPEMDGFEATRNLRSSHNQIPVIALTANAITGDDQLCFEAGMNDYISKPFKPEDLFRKLKDWLRRP